MSDATDEAFAKANAFLDRGVSKLPNKMLFRKQPSASYSTLAERRWVPGAFTVDDWHRLAEHLKEWHTDGRRSLTLKAVATMRDVTVDEVDQEPGAERVAGATANTSRGRVAPALLPLRESAIQLPVVRSLASRPSRI